MGKYGFEGTNYYRRDLKMSIEYIQIWQWFK
jgi:hypothetical protein